MSSVCKYKIEDYFEEIYKNNLSSNSEENKYWEEFIKNDILDTNIRNSYFGFSNVIKKYAYTFQPNFKYNAMQRILFFSIALKYNLIQRNSYYYGIVNETVVLHELDKFIRSIRSYSSIENNITLISLFIKNKKFDNFPDLELILKIDNKRCFMYILQNYIIENQLLEELENIIKNWLNIIDLKLIFSDLLINVNSCNENNAKRQECLQSIYKSVYFNLISIFDCEKDNKKDYEDLKNEIYKVENDKIQTKIINLFTNKIKVENEDNINILRDKLENEKLILDYMINFTNIFKENFIKFENKVNQIYNNFIFNVDLSNEIVTLDEFFRPIILYLEDSLKKFKKDISKDNIKYFVNKIKYYEILFINIRISYNLYKELRNFLKKDHEKFFLREILEDARLKMGFNQIKKINCFEQIKNFLNIEKEKNIQIEKKIENLFPQFNKTSKKDNKDYIKSFYFLMYFYDILIIYFLNKGYKQFEKSRSISIEKNYPVPKIIYVENKYFKEKNFEFYKNFETKIDNFDIQNKKDFINIKNEIINEMANKKRICLIFLGSLDGNNPKIIYTITVNLYFKKDEFYVDFISPLGNNKKSYLIYNLFENWVSNIIKKEILQIKDFKYNLIEIPGITEGDVERKYGKYNYINVLLYIFVSIVCKEEVTNDGEVIQTIENILDEHIEIEKKKKEEGNNKDIDDDVLNNFSLYLWKILDSMGALELHIQNLYKLLSEDKMKLYYNSIGKRKNYLEELKLKKKNLEKIPSRSWINYQITSEFWNN